MHWHNISWVIVVPTLVSKTKSQVRTRRSETESFEVQLDKLSVRQECSASPHPFNFVIDWILRDSMVGMTGVQINITPALTHLAYTYDIVILGESYEAVQKMVNGIHRFTNAVGLRISAAKTKELFTKINTLSRGTITLDDVRLGKV